MSNTIHSIIQKQTAFYQKGCTIDFKSRKQRLEILLKSLEDYTPEITRALKKDLGKSHEEALMTEIREVRKEIEYTIKNFQKWAKIKKVPTPVTLFGSKSRIIPEPLGKILIIAPWNYPFNLSVMPVIPALAAGNTVIIKPSELAPETSSVICDMISKNFSSEEIAVIEGGVDETSELLNHPFDHIFFTGGETVGKIVMKAASANLTPVTLELGGKSPAIVLKDANIKTSAKRIAWAKFTNAGQTCVAPDYVLIDRSVKDDFLKEIKKSVVSFYGENPKESPFYGRIINDRHFERLEKLLKNQKPVTKLETDSKARYIAPTVLDEVSTESPVMQEEIFGPVLPVLTVDSINEAIDFVTKRPKPLALYVFSENKKNSSEVLLKTSSGGACVNDAIVHLSSHHLPFGGVGISGMGAYHGRFGFETFSHFKSVVSSTTKFDIPLRYPPFPKWFKKLMNIL
ncbi:MAG: aldehyde dehydrogenase [Desulfobacteraceae bacterium]|nr:aldehyde dehydrogenase [Desulfobacteraceae bacterium]MCB9494703.1 aldehyde dehydrogenase [Desulfobacteraceae bacterium]